MCLADVFAVSVFEVLLFCCVKKCLPVFAIHIVSCLDSSRFIASIFLAILEDFFGGVQNTVSSNFSLRSSLTPTPLHCEAPKHLLKMFLESATRGSCHSPFPDFQHGLNLNLLPLLIAH